MISQSFYDKYLIFGNINCIQVLNKSILTFQDIYSRQKYDQQQNIKRTPLKLQMVKILNGEFKKYRQSSEEYGLFHHNTNLRSRNHQMINKKNISKSK